MDSHLNILYLVPKRTRSETGRKLFILTYCIRVSYALRWIFFHRPEVYPPTVPALACTSFLWNRQNRKAPSSPRSAAHTRACLHLRKTTPPTAPSRPLGPPRLPDPNLQSDPQPPPPPMRHRLPHRASPMCRRRHAGGGPIGDTACVHGILRRGGDPRCASLSGLLCVLSGGTGSHHFLSNTGVSIPLTLLQCIRPPGGWISQR